MTVVEMSAGIKTLSTRFMCSQSTLRERMLRLKNSLYLSLRTKGFTSVRPVHNLSVSEPLLRLPRHLVGQ